MLVVGDKELDAKKVAIRSYHAGDRGTQAVSKFAKDLAAEISERRLPQAS
jgi:threonyl-tRNA synthetase